VPARRGTGGGGQLIGRERTFLARCVARHDRPIERLRRAPPAIDEGVAAEAVAHLESFGLRLAFAGCCEGTAETVRPIAGERTRRSTCLGRQPAKDEMRGVAIRGIGGGDAGRVYSDHRPQRGRRRAERESDGLAHYAATTLPAAFERPQRSGWQCHTLRVHARREQ
jgi:hypothetical protein